MCVGDPGPAAGAPKEAAEAVKEVAAAAEAAGIRGLLYRGGPLAELVRAALAGT